MGTLIKGGRHWPVVVLGLLALGLASSACDRPPSHKGGIDLIATLPAGVAVEVLTYKLTGDGYGGLAGGLHVSKPQHDFEKLINYVPVGDDYELDVTAKSTDERFMCKGSTKVSVRQSSITRVHVALTCTGGDGNVLIDVNVANADGSCPGVPQLDYMVSPLTASVGEAIVVNASTHTGDAGALSYDWSAPSGAFANPSAAHTTYQCESPGYVTLSLRVTSSGCAEAQSVDVDCVDPKDSGAD